VKHLDPQFMVIVGLLMVMVGQQRESSEHYIVMHFGRLIAVIAAGALVLDLFK
jgi:hypothetical protein